MIAVAAMQPATAAAQSQSPAGGEEAAVEMLVVTARRRAESIQDVPISITALSGAAVERTAAIRVADALNTVPNLSFESNSLGGSAINIRGVSASANNFGMESAVGVYVDEVYLARPSIFDQTAVDLERVEVLRGPQGTLFGRNTIAGVLNITTAAPSQRPQASAQVSAGRFDLRQVRASVSGPLNEALGARLSISRTKRDGWFRQQTPGLPDFNNIDNVAGRAKLAFKPNDAFEATATFDYARDNSVSGNNKVVAGPLAAFDRFGPDESATTIPGRERREFHMGSLRMNQDVGRHVLTSITAFQRIKYDRFNDQDYTALDILSTGAPESDRQFSQELRLASAADTPLTYIAGVYYAQGKVNGRTRAVLGRDVPLALGLPAIPNYTESVDTQAAIEQRSWALFGSAVYRFSAAWEASLGLRYTDEHKRLDYAQAVSPFFVAPGRPVGVIYTLAADVPGLRQTYDDGALTGDATLTYRWTPEVSAYARLSRGYKGGGFETAPAVTANPGDLAFDPEFVNLGEIGFKGAFSDRRIRLNAAAFYMDYADKQEQVFNGASFNTSNAAEATVKGAEAELTVVVATGLSVAASGGYTHAEYGRYVDPLAGSDNSGNRLPGSARWSGALAADYVRPLSAEWRLSTHAEAAYRSRSFTTPDNNAAYVSGARTLVNARVGIERSDGRHGLFVWGRNITNERYLLGGFSFLGSTFAYRNQPATWGVELRVSY